MDSNPAPLQSGRHVLRESLAEVTTVIPPAAPAEPPSAQPQPFPAPSSPESASRAVGGPIERKVAFGALWGLLASAGAVLLQQLAEHVDALAFLPPWATTVVLVVAPPLAAALAGYATAHTPRPDLG